MGKNKCRFASKFPGQAIAYHSLIFSSVGDKGTILFVSDDLE